MNARDPGRRETPGKVLKDRHSPRRRGRMGTSQCIERALFGRYVFGGHASRTSYAMSESAISPLCGFERGFFGVVGDGAAGSERDGERESSLSIRVRGVVVGRGRSGRTRKRPREARATLGRRRRRRVGWRIRPRGGCSTVATTTTTTTTTRARALARRRKMTTTTTTGADDDDARRRRRRRGARQARASRHRGEVRRAAASTRATCSPCRREGATTSDASEGALARLQSVVARESSRSSPTARFQHLIAFPFK